MKPDIAGEKLYIELEMKERKSKYTTIDLAKEKYKEASSNLGNKTIK